MKARSIITVQFFTSLFLTFHNLPYDLRVMARTSFLSIEIVTLGYTCRQGIGALPFTAPVMDSVVSQLQILYRSSFNITHTYWFTENSSCQSLKETSEFYLSEWYYRPTAKYDLHVYIAPTCYDSLSVYQLLSAWNLLMISTVIGPETGVVLPNRNWIYTGSTSYSDYATIYINFLLRYNWTSHIYITIDQDSPSGFVIFGKAVYAALVVRFPVMQITLKFVKSKSEAFDIPDLLKQISISSRIAGLFVSAAVLRKIMTEAHAHNMTDGSYVFISSCNDNPNDKVYGNATWKYDDEYDEVARLAFLPVFFLMPVSSSPATPESEKWMAAVPETFDYDFKKPSRQLLDTYYAFRMFGLVINETLASQPDFDWSNGHRLGKRFCNRTFHFQSGSMFISPDGERRNLMTLKQYQKNSSECQFAFLQDPQIRAFTNVTTVQWVSGYPPAAVPLCGFENQHCEQTPTTSAKTALAVFLVFLPLSIFVPWWRSRLMKSCADDLDPLWWKIEGYSLRLSENKSPVSMYMPTLLYDTIMYLL